MDEFWRKKDLSISGNCPGGPAVTPGGHNLNEPPSGHVVTTEVVPGHVGSPFPSYPPPFDPTVPPPPLPPALSAPPPSVPPVVVPPIAPPNLNGARPNQPDIYSNPPPVIYYPPEPVMPPIMPPPPLMEDTPEKTQTATNIRYVFKNIL